MLMKYQNWKEKFLGTSKSYFSKFSVKITVTKTIASKLNAFFF